MMISDEDLKELIDLGCGWHPAYPDQNVLATELLARRQDCADSLNHNENVVQPVMDKLIAAGMKPAGLSWMVDELIDKQVVSNPRTKLERAFQLGQNWGETYGGWFQPTEADTRERIDAMLAELFPSPPRQNDR
jgi:hypothetical protein